MHVADITPEILGDRKYTKKGLASYLSEACKLLVDLAVPQGSATPSSSTTPSRRHPPEQWWRCKDDDKIMRNYSCGPPKGN